MTQLGAIDPRDGQWRFAGRRGGGDDYCVGVEQGSRGLLRG